MASEEEVLGKAYDSRLMKRLLTYLRPYKWQVGIALASILMKAGADVLGPYLTKIVIDRYLAPVPGLRTPLDRFLSSKPLVGIAQIAALYVGLLVFSFLLEYLQTYFMQWAGQKTMFDMRAQIFRHLQRMHIGFYDKNPVGRLVTRVTTDVDAVNEMFTSGVVSIFEDVFVLAGIIAIMLRMNWKLALITFAVLPLIGIATKIFRDKVRDSYRRIRVAIARINAYLQEHVSGMVVLQLFNREERAFDKFSEVNAVHMDAFKDAIMAHAVYYPVVEVLSAIAIACVIWFGGNSIRERCDSDRDADHALAFWLRSSSMRSAFSGPSRISARSTTSCNQPWLRANAFSSCSTHQLRSRHPHVTKTPEGPGRIEFDHVWFAYRTMPTNDRWETITWGRPLPTVRVEQSSTTSGPDWVLRDVSFTIEPGETVAFVGHTGAGKTTIISLLMRFYDVQKGAIKIDGVDVKDMDLADLRRRFGVVLQDPFLFSGTVASNIRLGTEGIDDEDVEKAAEDVNLADFIRTLPNGFKEEVRERGSTLSTGQKQLISFARALAHDPKILILDEATSSVDTETEFRVRDALSRMVEGRTSVIIAHRLSTIQRADKIVVMHKGQVREMGSHQQLLAHHGHLLQTLSTAIQRSGSSHELPSNRSSRRLATTPPNTRVRTGASPVRAE